MLSYVLQGYDPDSGLIRMGVRDYDPRIKATARLIALGKHEHTLEELRDDARGRSKDNRPNLRVVEGRLQLGVYA